MINNFWKAWAVSLGISVLLIAPSLSFAQPMHPRNDRTISPLNSGRSSARLDGNSELDPDAEPETDTDPDTWSADEGAEGDVDAMGLATGSSRSRSLRTPRGSARLSGPMTGENNNRLDNNDDEISDDDVDLSDERTSPNARRDPAAQPKVRLNKNRDNLGREKVGRDGRRLNENRIHDADKEDGLILPFELEKLEDEEDKNDPAIKPRREDSILEKSDSKISATSHRLGQDGPATATDKPISSVEKLFQGKYPESNLTNLLQFGYGIFNRKRMPFTTPSNDIPVAEDYIVGPGDRFRLDMWGGVNSSTMMTVRSDGTIYLPRVGIIKVVGLEFSKMEKLIQSKVGTFYSGVKANVSFGRIHMLNVFIMGEVAQPGSYSVPSTASVVNALFYAGGPSKNGSLRGVKLIRGDKEVGAFDIYDFLVRGSSRRVQLQSQDVIMVPVIGAVAAVNGQVKRPAIYEIQKDTKLADLLELAGGLSFNGSTGRISLQRVEKNQKRITKDFMIPEDYTQLKKEDLAKGDLGTPVLDGDLIRVFPILPTLYATVFLKGYVKRPGAYEFHQGMKLKDVLASYDQLLDDPYTEYVQVIRTLPPKDEKSSLFVNLKDLLEGVDTANIALEPRDEIIAFSKEQLDLKDKVTIEGKVNKPGRYYYFAGMTIRDLVLMAGNLTQDAYVPTAEVARYKASEDNLNYDHLRVKLDEAIKSKESAENIVLQPRDRVLIRGLPNWELKNFIALKGEVKFPGNYSYGPKERLSSVIERAGGFTEKAFLDGAIFTRVSVKELQAKSLKEQISRLQEAVIQESVRGRAQSVDDSASYQEAITARKTLLKELQSAEASGRMVIKIEDLKKLKNSKFDITLEPGDSLGVPPLPAIVNVMGEVFNQTSLVYLPGKTVQYYLDLSGGLTMNADSDNLLIIKADGSVVSKRQKRGFLLRDFYQMEVGRGDTLLVPKDISRFSWMGPIKDWTEILFKIASTTGITITALK